MAQQVTTPFWPVFARKSDGKQVLIQKGRTIKNNPSDEQLDRTPNAQGQCDYYRLLDHDEPKHVDWRKKLGGLLLREIGGKQYEDKWQQCVLYDFPEGYRLYEHIKSKVDGQAKAVKNHSGGGHDRQDAYLYGHPKGPKKRFRSPLEFFPHLLWLATDETNDPENCTCKLCSPLQLEPEKAATPATPAPAQQVAGRHPTVQIPIRRPSEPGATASPATRQPPTPQSQAQHQPQAARPPAPTYNPTPLPQPRNADQQIDGQYGKLLVRVGEVVWFQREEEAWGLGLILRRWISKDGLGERTYMVQPLSHPYDSQAVVTMQEHTKLKPWLAWSAPACTYPYLQQHPHATYPQVDWRALMTNRFGSGNPEVDASILGAKAVDGTYTLFERLKTTTNMGQEERHWNGIYYGAEKIWNGEPVRIHWGSGTDIMVITDIIEIPRPAQAGAGGPPQQGAVHIVGDVYSYATIPAPDPNSPPTPPSNPYLPIRMREDMRWRNQSLVPIARELAYWRLQVSQKRLAVSEIKGRWYETSIIFAAPFHEAVKSGKGGNGIWMNARGDCNLDSEGKKNPIPAVPVPDRIQAFGAAVPKGTVLVEGLEPPNQNIPNKAPTQELQGLELGQAAGDGGFALDDFMNLEGMGEDGMAFQENFGFEQSGNWPA